MTAADEPRQHGLQAPLDNLQYLAAFAYVLFTASFAVLHAPMLTPSAWQYAVIAIFCVWIPLSVASYIIAAMSKCHPTELDDEPPVSYGELIRMPDPPGKKACRECLIMVPESCKHCYACGKCVLGFDHHCRWLNHCVGELNYAHFAVFLGNTFTLLALQAALGWWLSIESATSWDTFQYRALRAFKIDSSSGATALAFFMWFIAVLEFLVVIVLGQLYFLHIELNFRGITTWDLIQIKRRDSRVRKSERAALGIPVDGNDTPTCHSFVVWQRERELGKLAPASGEADRLKYAPSSAFETVQPEEADMSERAETEPSLNTSMASDQRSTRSSSAPIGGSPGLRAATSFTHHHHHQGSTAGGPQHPRRHSSAVPTADSDVHAQEMLVPSLLARTGSGGGGGGAAAGATSVSPSTSSVMSPDGSAGMPAARRQDPFPVQTSRSASDVDDADDIRQREPRGSKRAQHRRTPSQSMDV